LLGFVAGTALFGFIVGAALLSVVAAATDANAYTPGVGSPGAPHVSIRIHNSLSSSLGDSGRRDNWNSPLDFQGNDPAEATKTIGKGTGGGRKSSRFSPASRHPGYPRPPLRSVIRCPVLQSHRARF
jgi:hypothetical protein